VQLFTRGGYDWSDRYTGITRGMLVRIPTKSAVDSGRSRPPVPIEAGRAFR
jgi:ATP-dependent DNA ligase